jgi:hypothetical protein
MFFVDIQHLLFNIEYLQTNSFNVNSQFEFPKFIELH